MLWKYIVGIALLLIFVFAVYQLVKMASLPSKFASQPAYVIDFTYLRPGFTLLKPWLTETRPSAGIQTYTDNNWYWEDGALVIAARKGDEEYTSSRFYTQGIFEFLYGRLQIEAKLPSGAGTWPAIWLRSEDEPFGEIDILEAQGARPGLVFSNIHNTISRDGLSDMYSGSANVGSMYTDFHTYELQWEPEVIRFLVDGSVYHEIKRINDTPEAWPFDRPYHLVINLAMGGKWAEDLALRTGMGSANGIDDSMQNSWKFYIRSIRYFPYLGE